MIAVNCGVPRQTLGNRIKGKHKPARKSQVLKQIHTEAEKDVLVDWIQYPARPLSRRTLTKKVSRSPSHVERLLEIGVVSFRCTLSTKYSSPMVASIAPLLPPARVRGSATPTDIIFYIKPIYDLSAANRNVQRMLVRACGNASFNAV